MTPNNVLPNRLLDYGRGPAGGRVPIPAGWGRPLACSVQGTGYRLGDGEHGGEQQVTTYDVLFHGTDPALAIRDQLLWTDPSPPVLLTVTGVIPKAGQLVTWVASCEEVL